MIVGNRTPSYIIAADNVDQYHSETILGAPYASGSNITRRGSTLGATYLSLLTPTGTHEHSKKGSDIGQKEC